MRGLLRTAIGILTAVILLEVLVMTDVLHIPFLTNHTPVVEYGEDVRVDEVISESLNEIGELYTMEYCYTMLSSTTNPLQIFGIEMPVGEKRLSYIYSGTLRVGVDLAAAKIDEVGNAITVTFPEMIANNTYDEDSIEFYDVKQYSFNKKALETYQASRIANLEAVKEKAAAAGIYDRAKVNLESMLDREIAAVLRAAGVTEHYDVHVVIRSDEVKFL